MKKTSKIVCKLLLFFIVITSFLGFLKPIYAIDSENIVGDLIITGNEIREYIDTQLTIYGNIIIKNNATLRFERTTIIFNQTGGAKYNITLENPINGLPRLIAMNSNITSIGTSIPIYMYGSLAILTNLATSSTFLITGSTLNASGIRSDIQAITAQDFSQVFLSDYRISIPRLYLDNSAAIVSNGRVKDLIALHNSSITLLDSRVENSLTLNSVEPGYSGYAKVDRSAISDVRVINSSAFIANSTVKGLTSRGTANLTIGNCEPPYIMTSVKVYDETKISISESEIATFASYNTSQAIVRKIRVVGSTSSVLIEGKSKADIYDSVIDYFTVSENATVSITDSTTLQALAEKNSSINMSEFAVKQWLLIFDNACVSISNSTMYQVLATSGFSTASASSSKLNIVYVSDSSSFSVSTSSISLLRVLDSSNVTVSSSQVEELQIQARSITGTIYGFNQVSVTYWNSAKNNSVLPRPLDSYVPDLTLKNMQLKNLTLQLFGDSNITIVNAKLKHIGASDNSIIKLENCTIETYEVRGDSLMYSYWYTAIHATNPQKAPMAGATVDVIDPTGIVIESGVTDANGWFRSDKFLEASVIASTGVQRTLIYEVSQGDYFARHSAAEFNSGNIEIELPILIPWYQQHWYILVIAIALAMGIVFVIAFIRFRKMPNSH